MIAQELEVCLHNAFVEARQQRHEYITVEQLLLALLGSSTASNVLRACGTNLDELRKNLTQHIAEQTPRIAADREVDTQPTLGFQRVLQQAILHVQTSGKKEVTGADALVAIFKEKDSHALRFLQQHAITRFDVVFYRAHGIAPTAKLPEPAEHDVGDLQVVLYNDDYTPMEFVVGVLQEFFSMSRDDATEAMLEVHRKGVALCGLHAREAAQEIVKSVLAHARQHDHPLRCAAVVPK